MVNKYYKLIDLFPLNYDAALLRHKQSLGVFLSKTVDGKNVAGLQLFRENFEFSLTIEKLICSIQAWSSVSVSILMIAIALIVAGTVFLIFYSLKFIN